MAEWTTRYYPRSTSLQRPLPSLPEIDSKCLSVMHRHSGLAFVLQFTFSDRRWVRYVESAPTIIRVSDYIFVNSKTSHRSRPLHLLNVNYKVSSNCYCNLSSSSSTLNIFHYNRCCNNEKSQTQLTALGPLHLLSFAYKLGSNSHWTFSFFSAHQYPWAHSFGSATRKNLQHSSPLWGPCTCQLRL